MGNENTWGMYKQMMTEEQRSTYLTERFRALFDPLKTGNQYYYESWKDGFLKEKRAPVSVFDAKMVISPENYQILYERLDAFSISDLCLLSPDLFIDERDWDINRSDKQRREHNVEAGLYADIERSMNKAIAKLGGSVIPEYRVVVPSPALPRERYCFLVDGEIYRTLKIRRGQLPLTLVGSGLEYSFKPVSTSGYLELAGTTSFLKISGTVFKGNLLDDSYLRMGLNADVIGLPPFPRVSFARRLGTTLYHALKKSN